MFFELTRWLLTAPARRAGIWALCHTILFGLFCLVLYRVTPIFLMQGHDGQNVYYLADGIFRWRASWLEWTTFSPLSGMASTFWPINPSFIPFLWPFALTDNPALRLYSLMVLASLMIFTAALLFFSSLRLRPAISIAAAWLTFAVYMLQTPDFQTGTDTLIAIVLVYVCLAIVAETGRHGLAANVAWFAGYQILFAVSIFAHPGWHILGMPLLLAVSCALCLGSDSKSEAMTKAAAVATGFALHAAIGAYAAIYYLLDDTARVMLANDFEPYQQIPYLAGNLFRGGPTEIVWSAFLILGLGVGRAVEFSNRPRLVRWISRLTLLIYIGSALTGLWFLYSGLPWLGPKPSYMLVYAYPLAALFSVLGVDFAYKNVATQRPPLAELLKSRRLLITALAIAALLGWHLLASPFYLMATSITLITFGGVFCLLRFGFGKAAILVSLVMAFVGFRDHTIYTMGGRGGQSNPEKRMAILPNPVVTYLHQHVGLRPGDDFRGYADDFYGPRPSQLINQIIDNWAGNWETYGNGMKLFNWSANGIPTLTAYSPYIDPLYFFLFSGRLNAPNEHQVVNYLTITRPDIRLLQLWGLRYLVTNETLPEMQPAMKWDKFLIYELPNPNLASYTPTVTILARNLSAALTAFASDHFDPMKQVLVDETVAAEDLVPAPPARLVFVRGGYRVEASSAGRSLVILPIQFSHCFTVVSRTGDPNARLLRANVIETGLLFSGQATLTLQYRLWPLVSEACRRQDDQDSRRFLTEAKGEP